MCLSNPRSDSTREKMRKKFLSNPDYNFAKINNASTACGPMVKWAIAQVRVCRIWCVYIGTSVSCLLLL